MKRLVPVLIILGMAGCAGFQTGNSAQDAFDLGVTLFDLEKYTEASEQFKTAIDRNPEFDEAYLFLGKAYIKQRLWLDAVKVLKSAYELSPKESRKEAFDILTDAVIEGADQLSELGKLSTWLGFLGNAMAKHPELTQNAQKAAIKMMAMARQLADAENYQPALELLQHLVKNTSAKVSDFFDLALEMAKRGYRLKPNE